MKPEDCIRLQHMADAAREALSFAKGKKRQNLNGNRMLVLAIIKDVEIVGEAATRITEKTRKALPDVPWSSIVAR